MWNPKKSGVTGGFFLLCAWFGMVNGWALLWYVLFAAAIHELGHFLVLRWFGVPVEGISLGALGANMVVRTETLSYGREVLCALAGPGMNLLWALWFQGRNQTFAGIHFSLCVFNLLPIAPLDGGRALSALLSCHLAPGLGEVISIWIGSALAGALSLGLVWVMVVTAGSLWLAPMAVGFFLLSLGIFKKKGDFF